MGRGSYLGGSTIAGASWFGYGSGSYVEPKKKKPRLSKIMRKAIAEAESREAAIRAKKSAEVRAEAKRLANERRTQVAADKVSNPRPGHGDPAAIRKRLQQRTANVEVAVRANGRVRVIKKPTGR